MQHKTRQVNRFSMFVILLAIALSGCQQDAQQTDQPTTVRKMDVNTFKHIIKDRDGKILFVNIWATWGEPCRNDFPVLVHLADKYHDADVEIITISTDFPDEVQSKIVPFLNEQGVNFPTYVEAFPSDEAFINAVNPEWSGALPATVVYDAQGVLRNFHIGQANLDTFVNIIESVRNNDEVQ